jgi:hypothetical protein
VAILLSPVLTAALAWMGRDDSRASWWLLALVLTGGAYLVTPNAVETVSGSMNMLLLQYHSVRFGVPLLVLCVITAAMIGQHVVGSCEPHRLVWCGLRSAIVLVVSIQILWHVLPLLGVHGSAGARLWPGPGKAMPQAVLTLMADAGVGLLLFSRYGLPRAQYMRWAGVGLSIAGFGLASGIFGARWHKSYDVHFRQVMMTDLYQWLDPRIGADDRLCVCDYRYYPCLGSRRQRQVCRPFRLIDRQVFEKYLAEQRVTHVLVLVRDTHDTQAYEAARHWVRADANRYEFVGSVAQFELYRRRWEQ